MRGLSLIHQTVSPKCSRFLLGNVQGRLSPLFPRFRLATCRASSEGSKGSPRRILFLTLEYSTGTFSGNGVYSKSLVASLSRLGHSVFVISAAPRDREQDSNKQPKNTLEHSLVEISVDEWGRLDWKSPWREFAAGISRDVVRQVAAFRPEWALVVDWSAVGAFNRVVGDTSAWEAAGSKPPWMTYLNYRVFSISDYEGEESLSEREFYFQKEREASSTAWGIIAASSRDAAILQRLFGSARPPGSPCAQALLPSLREDIRQVALEGSELASSPDSCPEQEAAEWSRGRKYMTCCVRLSPEKNAALFADLVTLLAPFLEDRGVVPLVCAGVNKSAYAEEVIRRVKESCPSAEIIREFLGPRRLAQVFSQTVLNIHPCVYDAFGMTVVECAAFGAPSLVSDGTGGTVGASELLPPQKGMSIPVNMTLPAVEIAQRVRHVLNNGGELSAIGLAAQRCALEWSEEANGRALVEIQERFSVEREDVVALKT